MRRYYEFALVVVLISVLALFMMRALERTRVDMEEAMVQADVAALRLGLMEVVVHRESAGGVLPESNNPVDWVAVRPASYVGELDAMPGGRSVWYFDRQAKELVYLFHDGHRARFRISRNGGIQNAREVVAGVSLLRLEDKRE
ncbi:hypothetical protein [Ferribacterium limneticum]|uniref:hypothetical protein n=1 Tax=Ferribacterium limneticum TaxID=76259 RepID=UPI001CFA12D1|nr:hypothetical protein [Ferribacterium limneticum]UCV19878.1 hypothetical protein KI610_04705 [Ferribacterium limneticum]